MGTSEVKQFLEKIMAIQAPAQNVFGTGIPGMMGASGAANQAASLGGDDVVRKLKQESVELAKLYARQPGSTDTTKKIEEVEGLLLMASAVTVITEVRANELVDELHATFDQ